MAARPSRSPLAAIGLIGLLLFACGDDGASTEPSIEDPLPPLVFPSTPDSLILAYQNAYEMRNTAALDSLLAPGFTFVFAPSDVDTFGSAPSWGKAAEIEASRRLFEGAEGVWPDGTVHPPANDFPFNCAIVPLDGTAWMAGSADGTRIREFEVSMLVNLIDFNIHFVGGTNLFEVVDMSGVGGPEGQEATGWAISKWTDLGLSGGLADWESRTARHVSTWGFVKAVYGNGVDSTSRRFR